MRAEPPAADARGGAVLHVWVTGSNGGSRCCEVPAGAAVRDVRHAVGDLVGARERLCFGGRALREEALLADEGIGAQAQLSVSNPGVIADFAFRVDTAGPLMGDHTWTVTTQVRPIPQPPPPTGDGWVRTTAAAFHKLWRTTVPAFFLRSRVRFDDVEVGMEVATPGSRAAGSVSGGLRGRVVRKDADGAVVRWDSTAWSAEWIPMDCGEQFQSRASWDLNPLTVANDAVVDKLIASAPAHSEVFYLHTNVTQPLTSSDIPLALGFQIPWVGGTEHRVRIEAVVAGHCLGYEACSVSEQSGPG